MVALLPASNSVLISLGGLVGSQLDTRLGRAKSVSLICLLLAESQFVEFV